MELSKFLPVLIQEYRKKTGSFPAKTKLLKLAYLAEAEHFSNTGRRLLDEEWVYFHFGPFIFGYDEALESPDIEFEKGESSSGLGYQLVGLSENFRPITLDFDASNAIHHVVADFANMNLNELLDYVYFDTEPMLTVKQRGEQLDMSTVKPVEYYRIREHKVPPKKLAEFRRKYREKGKKLRGSA